MREPPGLRRDDGRRPDGVTLIPLFRRENLGLEWNGCRHPSPSHVDAGSLTPRSAAVRAETLKLQKYASLAADYFVSALAFETLGGPGPTTKELLVTIGQLLQEATIRNFTAEKFQIQRLSLDIQRGNAAAVIGTLETYWGPLSVYQNRTRTLF